MNEEQTSTEVKKHRRNDPERNRESSRRWRERHRDRDLESKAQWREINKDHHNKYNAEWRKTHVEQARAARQRYDDRRKQNGGNFTRKEFDALCKRYNYRCLACGEQKPLTSDHVIPVSRGGSSDIQNIQPLCLSCNDKKRDKVIDYRF